MLEQRAALAEMKDTMEHASAEHSVSLKDMKQIVRDSSLEKLAVERERIERQIEIKKVRLTLWARVLLCGCWFGVFMIVEVELTVTYLPL